jgi:demethylmenaquinone methyltransferase/2-methoxy-6-polyprenyl-1,4-benzoquinol methylase/phosphoethanolamine N-methyltransferase
MGHATGSSPQTRGDVLHWARAYDLLTRLGGFGPRSAGRRMTIEHADLQSGEKVLDVGCGPGMLTLLAAERVGATGEAHGIDPSPEMVKLAKEKAAKAPAPAAFREGVIEALPYADASFDAVLSSLMLHHLPEDLRRTGFAEIARVLKPGGRLIAFDLGGDGSWTWRIMSLVGHRLPEKYGEHLASQMSDAGLSPRIIETKKKQYIVIDARKSR